MSGPWKASFNDAKILMTELQDHHQLRQFFTGFNESYDGDCIMILDRGYRDSLSCLDEYGIKYEMPSMCYAYFKTCIKYILALQQVQPRIFDEMSDISVRLSQMSQTSRPEDVSDSEIASQRPNISNSDSGVIAQQPSSSQRSQNRRSQRRTRRPWDVYLSTKPLIPCGLANRSRLVSSQRHSIEVNIQ